MQTQTVILSTADGDMPTYEAVPDSAPRGGVIVVQEAFGVTEHIEDVARRFAAAGYHALAPHLYHRQGAPVLGYDQLEQALPLMGTLTRDSLLADLDAALQRLASVGLPASRVAVVGFCMGGTVAFLAAVERPIGAAVTFYGGGVVESRWEGVPALVELAPHVQAPWLGLYGDQDVSIPVEQVERLREAVADAVAPAELVRYPEAGHGFHCDARPANYHAQSAKDAWQRTLAWLEEHLD